jgi:hypothetical protein
LRILLDESRARPFGGAVMQLGRQDIYASLAQLKDWARAQGASLKPVEAGASNRPELRAKGYTDDATIFKAFGFDTVHSCDVSNYQGASHIFDLNQPLPDDLRGKYDLVVDGGTIEHIFDQAALFRNIHALLKPGGCVIHMTPSTNHMDHGLYMYSPTLLHDYYTANKYKILTSYLLQYDMTQHESTLIPIYEYRPGCLPQEVMFDARMSWLIYFVAMKTGESLGNAIPQQGCSGSVPAPDLASKIHEIARESGPIQEWLRRRRSRTGALRYLGQY